MNSPNSLNNNQQLFSESFLNYLNIGNINKQTYCEEKSNKYHDSSYIWCRICDKIFCTQCSMNHLIANQITHNPSDRIFLRKEHFDVEFNRDLEKLKELSNKIINFFSKKNSEITNNKIIILKDSLTKLTTLTNELSTIIIPKLKNMINIYKESIDALIKSMKESKVITLEEKKVKIQYQAITDKFTKIEKKYTRNEKFEPKMIKTYYEELLNAYREIQTFNELLNNNDNANNSNNKVANKECEKINSDLSRLINILISFINDLSILKNN